MHGVMVEQIVVFTWYAIWLATIRGCVEITHQSCTFPSLHISKPMMWDVVCICYYGIVKDDNSYSFVCWKHDICYVIVPLGLIGVNLYSRELKASRIDAETLWELLVQRGFAKQDAIHQLSFPSCDYLTYFGFCIFIFDPAGHLFC